MNFLVTGGAGFIGSNIVEALLLRGHKVRVLDNFSSGKRQNLNAFAEKIELIEGDIRSYHIVRQAVENIEIILHQAALPSVPRSINDPITTDQVNVSGTLNILQAAKDAKVKRLVFASSSSIYGDNPELPKHEGMMLNPLSPYAVSKLAGEKYFNVFARLYGMHTVSLRYFNVFGPRQDPSSQYSAVIPKFISAVTKNESPVIYGDGLQARDFTYIANVVKANILAATADCPPGLSANIACNQLTSLNDVVKKLGEIHGVKVVPQYKSARAGDIKESLAAIEVAQKYLGYTPDIYFDEGLALTVQWFNQEMKN